MFQKNQIKELPDEEDQYGRLMRTKEKAHNNAYMYMYMYMCVHMCVSVYVYVFVCIQQHKVFRELQKR